MSAPNPLIGEAPPVYRGKQDHDSFRTEAHGLPGFPRSTGLSTDAAHDRLKPREHRSLPDLRVLLREVGRRHVARVAVVYGAAAFGVLEVADIVIPALGWGEWTIKWIIGLAIVGFPVTLILAWVYDLTPGGVVRTPALEEGEGVEERGGGGEGATGRRRRVDRSHPVLSGVLLLASGALVAAGAFLTFEWSHDETGPGSPVSDATADGLNPLRIAVLPFVDLDNSDSGGFFANGIHEDILNYLAKIASLEVISRTTLLQYRDTEKSARQIGEELDAGSILEGSVRKQGGQIRVVTQLIDARSDRHIWSETYDRPETDIFEVQSDIAQEIAQALQAQLTPEERLLLGASAPVSGEAYEKYSQGIFEWDLRENRVNALRAANLFQEATELDSEFALAFAALSQARMWLFWKFPGFQDQAELAGEALDRALELAPEAVETRLAQGYFYFYGRADSEEALRYFTEAEAGKPSDANVISAIGLIHRGQGRWEEAVAAFERARTYDPRSYNLNFTLAETYLRMRRFPEAERYFELAATLAPEVPVVYQDLLRVKLAQAGDTASARAFVQGLPRSVSSRVRESLNAELAYYRRDFQRARVSSDPQGPGGRPYERLALLYHVMGQDTLRDAYADSLRQSSEAVLAQAGRNRGAVQSGVIARAHAKLGIANALLGDGINAWVEGSSAVNLLPVSVDAYEGADLMMDLATIYTLIGESELAVQQLRTVLSIPSALTRSDLLLDPVFDPLRDQPAFADLLSPAE